MNKERRKKIEELAEKAAEIKIEIEELLEAEQEAFDNLPESLQEGERGEAMQAAIDSLESASSSIDETVEYLNEVCNS